MNSRRNSASPINRGINETWIAMPTPPTPGCRRKWHYNKPLHAIGETANYHDSSDGTIKITGVYTPIKPTAIKCLIFFMAREALVGQGLLILKAL